MATRALNNQKRDAMREHMSRVLALGVSTKQAAALLGCSPGNVSAWARGANMGTNAVREVLQKLTTLEEVRERAGNLADTMRRGLAEAPADHARRMAGYQARIEEAKTPEFAAKKRAWWVEYRKKYRPGMSDAEMEDGIKRDLLHAQSAAYMALAEKEHASWMKRTAARLAVLEELAGRKGG